MNRRLTIARAVALAGALLLGAPVSARPAPERAAAPRVELLTMGPGDATYTRFGHAAFLVSRPGRHAVVYNFGYSNFARPGLVTDFLRGKARFWVAVEPYGRTLASYRAEDRTLWRQELSLSPAARRWLAGALERVARPENRDYIYHHFDDNCTTRLRDLLDRVSGGEVRRVLSEITLQTTLRELMRRGFAGQTGLQLLADTIVGRRADRALDGWEAAFLPRYHAELLQLVRLPPDNRPLAGEPRLVYRRQGPPPLAKGRWTGRILLWAAAGAVLLLGLVMIRAAGRGRRLAALPLWFGALLSGGLGALLWGLALYSTLPELRQNELLLLFWPTDLLLVGVAARWAAGGARAGAALRLYAGARLAGGALLLLGLCSGALIQRPAAYWLLGLLWVGALFFGVGRAQGRTR